MTEPRRLGKYRLVRRLAVGGVAEVYLAIAEGPSGFAKRVVLKRLLPERAREPEVLSMFLDEARLMALLDHPHIVEVYDIDSVGGEHVFAMEEVPGRDLRDVLDARPGQPLPLPAALALVRAVALGLAHAHAQRDHDGRLLGVVHRDVSPSNVLLGWDGDVKLVDFGVAKWAAQRSQTAHGILKGKFAYMSPEQCRAEPLDGRSDLFALAVVLYELTTGARPFVGESDFEMLSAIVAGKVVPPHLRAEAYPESLEAVVLRALQAKREARFADGDELAAALDGVARGLGFELDRVARAAVAEVMRDRFPQHEPATVEAAAAMAVKAADRTATDHASAGDDGAGLLRAAADALDRANASASGPSSRTAWGRAGRWWLVALAVVSVVSVGLWGARAGRAPAVRVPSSASVAAPPFVGRPPAATPPAITPPAPPAPIAATPTLPGSPGASERPRPARVPDPTVRPRARRPVPAGSAVPGTPAVWDPDSPVPP